MPLATSQLQPAHPLIVLTKRHDFLAAGKFGKKGVAASVILQAHAHGKDLPPRYGITASKKIGNAVTRNRAKRRLRHLAQQELSPQAKPGVDYVFIARHNTAQVSWPQLVGDFAKAMNRINKNPDQASS